MKRNYPAYPGDDAAIARFGLWADNRSTEIEVAAAIHTVEGSGYLGRFKRDAHAIWSDPTDGESDHIAMCLNEWARLGDIEARVYRWGSDSITVRNV